MVRIPSRQRPATLPYPRPGPAARLVGRGQQRRSAGQRQHEGPEGLPGRRGQAAGDAGGRLRPAARIACIAITPFSCTLRRNSSGLAQAGAATRLAPAQTATALRRPDGTGPCLSTALKETGRPEVKALTWRARDDQGVPVRRRVPLISMSSPGRGWTASVRATYRTAWTWRDRWTPGIPPGQAPSDHRRRRPARPGCLIPCHPVSLPDRTDPVSGTRFTTVPGTQKALPCREGP